MTSLSVAGLQQDVMAAVESERSNKKKRHSELVPVEKVRRSNGILVHLRLDRIQRVLRPSDRNPDVRIALFHLLSAAAFASIRAWFDRFTACTLHCLSQYRYT